MKIPRNIERQRLLNSVLVVTQPFPKNGGMVEDHRALEPGKLPRALTRGLRETRVDKEQAAQ